MAVMPLSVTKHTSREEDWWELYYTIPYHTTTWEYQLSEQHARGWRAHSAAGLQGRGSHTRSVFWQTPVFSLCTSTVTSYDFQAPYFKVSVWTPRNVAYQIPVSLLVLTSTCPRKVQSSRARAYITINLLSSAMIIIINTLSIMLLVSSSLSSLSLSSDILWTLTAEAGRERPGASVNVQRRFRQVPRQRHRSSLLAEPAGGPGLRGLPNPGFDFPLAGFSPCVCFHPRFCPLAFSPLALLHLVFVHLAVVPPAFVSSGPCGRFLVAEQQWIVQT